MAKTFDRLRTDINAAFPDVGPSRITPADLRGRMVDTVDSMESTSIELKASQFKKNPLEVDGKFCSYQTISRLTGAMDTLGGSKVVRYAPNRTGTSPVGSCPDKLSNVIRLYQDTTQVHAQLPIAPAIDCTTVRNIGIWARASKRVDGENGSFARIWVTKDNAGSIDFSSNNTFSQHTFVVPADGEWRLLVFPISPDSGWGGQGMYVPGTGNTMAWLRVGVPAGSPSQEERPSMGADDFLEFGSLVVNVRGSKALFSIRIDDNQSELITPMGNTWATAYPSGFLKPSSLSGVEITSEEGKLLSYIDLIEKFGLRATFYILCSYVGKRGFMSLAELKALQAKGHNICFQSYYNPTSSQAFAPFQKLGAKLLGAAGYNICPAGTITAQPSSTTLTWPNTHVSNGSAVAANPQGFPVFFEAGGVPASITALQKYWLRRVDNNTCSVHPTEYDAADNLNAINLTGCTPANLVIRYWNSSLGSTSIDEEFRLGREWMTENGFNDCPTAYAPNQSSVNLLIENAAVANGFTDIYTAGTPTADGWSGLSIVGANYAWTDFGSAFRYNPKFTLNSCATAEAQSEGYMREFVRRCVQEGAIAQDLVHNKGVEAAKAYIGYLDEVKYQVDQGLAVCETIDNAGGFIRSAQF